jgi:Flp pilus assembly protein TadB
MTILATPLSGGLLLGGTACAGLAVATAAWWLTSLVSGEQLDHLLPTESERQRRREQRRQSWLLRWCEPTVVGLAGRLGRWFPNLVRQLGAWSELIGLAGWQPAELLAVKALEAVPALLLGGAIGSLFFSPAMIPFIAVLTYFIILAGAVRRMKKDAARYVARIRGRLPSVIDLMALMLEAGAGTLRECLDRAAGENTDHPIGTELRRVIVQIDQGASQADALRELDRRLNDPEVREVVFAINTAEERGLSLKDSLRNLAGQMRLRQVQTLERLAEQARVHITWPGLVMTAACLLIVAAPLVLSIFETH